LVELWWLHAALGLPSGDPHMGKLGRRGNTHEQEELEKLTPVDINAKCPRGDRIIGRVGEAHDVTKRAPEKRNVLHG